MSDQPDTLILELLRSIPATQAEHAAVLARLDRRMPATGFNIMRIRRDNAGDAETPLATIMDLDERLSRLEQAAREPS